MLANIYFFGIIKKLARICELPILKLYLFFLYLKMEFTYQIIIAGAGMSGLSLLRLLAKAGFKGKILLIDKEKKNTNDRTWSFWQSDKDAHLIDESVVFKVWENTWFVSRTGKQIALDMGQFKYKMIRSQNYYKHCYDQTAKYLNCEIIFENIENIEQKQGFAILKTKNNTYFAPLIFDSIRPFPKERKFNNHYLLQHFMGKFVRFDTSVLNPDKPYIMDFSIPQHNECRFMYVLPFSETEAMIEFTIFSDALLHNHEYETQISEYINNRFGTSWQILETEFGIIPMTDESAKEFVSPNIIAIGASGGYINPATGYTFLHTQRRLDGIVNQIMKGKLVQNLGAHRHFRFNIYYSALLNLIEHNRKPAGLVFEKLFHKNTAYKVFKFLDSQTNFLEEIKIMYNSHKLAFTKSILSLMYKNIFKK